MLAYLRFDLSMNRLRMLSPAAPRLDGLVGKTLSHVCEPNEIFVCDRGDMSSLMFLGNSSCCTLSEASAAVGRRLVAQTPDISGNGR